MQIIIEDNKGNLLAVGNSNLLPIPRIGEKVFLGYNPSPTVKNVVYFYEKNMVLVYVDGFIVR